MFVASYLITVSFHLDQDSIVFQDRLQSINSQPHKTHNDIWQLFKEAQRSKHLFFFFFFEIFAYLLLLIQGI